MTKKPRLYPPAPACVFPDAEVYGQQRRTSRNSGHHVCEITPQQRKKGSLPFSSGLSLVGGNYLPKMPIWRLILLVLLPPGSPGCEKLNPTKPTSSPSKRPTSSPSFCLLSSWNNPPQVFPGHRPHRVDRIRFLYTPKDNAEGALTCDGRKRTCIHGDRGTVLQTTETGQSPDAAGGSPRATEAGMTPPPSHMVSHALGPRLPPWVEH